MIPVTSVAAAETKKITARNLLLGAIADLADDEIPGSKVDTDIENGSVGTDKLANDIGHSGQA